MLSVNFPCDLMGRSALFDKKISDKVYPNLAVKKIYRSANVCDKNQLLGFFSSAISFSANMGGNGMTCAMSDSGNSIINSVSIDSGSA